MSENDNTASGAPQEAGSAPSDPARSSAQGPSTEEQIRAAHIDEPALLDGPIRLVDYDPEWPRLFEREAARIRVALGEQIVLLEHVGSTSVPGLAAKPRIDILLVVPNSADEPAYVPALEVA
ncbi:MAG: GrpB family protein, partial [Ktedonobacteraceae bacterium]